MNNSEKRMYRNIGRNSITGEIHCFKTFDTFMAEHLSQSPLLWARTGIPYKLSSRLLGDARVTRRLHPRVTTSSVCSALYYNASVEMLNEYITQVKIL